MIHSMVSLAFDQLYPLDDLQDFVWDLVLTRPEIAFSKGSRARTVSKANKEKQKQKSTATKTTTADTRIVLRK